MRICSSPLLSSSPWNSALAGSSQPATGSARGEHHSSRPAHAGSRRRDQTPVDLRAALEPLDPGDDLVPVDA